MSGLRERLARIGTAPLDLAVALVALAIVALECATASAIQYPWLDLAWMAPLTLSLAWLRTHTATAVAVVYACALGVSFTGDSVVDFTSLFVIVMMVSFAVGLWLERGPAIIALVALCAVVVIVNLFHESAIAGDYVFPPAIFATWWTLGRFLRARQVLTEELRERTARLERERDELASAAADEERARVARELHDVVAHSMSVMVVQAGAARRVLDRSPQESIDALRTVESTGRETLEELRRLLGVLRPSGQPELQPAPQVRDLATLAERARAAGLKVDLRVSGDPAALPAATNLTLYRIVQEALTNSLRHAGESHASVQVRCEPGEVIVDVRDTGPPAGGPRSRTARGAKPAALVPGEGFGLVGMRERVELHGGELHTGPAPGGGFRVHARIPLAIAGDGSTIEQEAVTP
jgi:signal transduction histidine kinase